LHLRVKRVVVLLDVVRFHVLLLVFSCLETEIEGCSVEPVARPVRPQAERYNCRFLSSRRGGTGKKGGFGHFWRVLGEKPCGWLIYRRGWTG
jgi:hypothetical protein